MRATDQRLVAFGLALGSLVFSPPNARAQDAGARAAARRIMLEQAQEAAARGDHARALDLAQRAAAVEHSPSLRLFIAQQQEHLGNVAAAFGAADLCVRETDRSTVNRRDQILQDCQALRASLRNRVALINVELPAGAPAGAAVQVGETVLDPLFYGVPFPTNPGSVSVLTTAAGRAPLRVEYRVEAGAERHVVAEFGAAPAAAPVDPRPEQPARAFAAPTPADPGPADRPAPSPSLSARLVGPIVVGAAGVVGLAAGAALFGARNGALEGCSVVGDQVVCATQAQADRAYDSARPLALGATASLAAGAVLLAGSAAWGAAVIATQRGPRAQGAVSLAPAVAPSVLGLAARGAF